jgi:hypothetical protein
MLNKKKQAMEFKTDLNDTLRDLYKSETPINMQGDTSGLVGKARNKSVLPKLKVSLYCI